MKKKEIEATVLSVLKDYCINNDINTEIDSYTPLIGENKILDSMGLVNVIVDIETAFIDKNIEISLTSEAAMSSRISPFRSVSSLCNYIAKQLGMEENE
jgi:acyl carrier protein